MGRGHYLLMKLIWHIFYHSNCSVWAFFVDFMLYEARGPFKRNQCRLTTPHYCDQK